MQNKQGQMKLQSEIAYLPKFPKIDDQSVYDNDINVNN